MIVTFAAFRYSLPFMFTTLIKRHKRFFLSGKGKPHLEHPVFIVSFQFGASWKIYKAPGGNSYVFVDTPFG